MLAEVTYDSKWDEMDENTIVNLHLALADGVLSSIEQKKTEKDIWDHLARLYEARSLHNKNFLKRKLYALRMMESTSVTEHVNHLDTLFSQLTSFDCKIEPQEFFDDIAVTILEEENKRNNREDMQTSSRQVEALVVTRGRSMESGSIRSHNHGNVASTSEDGNALCCEAAVANEDGSVYSYNDHKLKITGIESIMVKMHDGTLVLMRREKVAANLYKLKEEIIEEAEASKATSWPHNGFFTFLRCLVYLINKKFDVFEVFKVYKARVELDSRKNIKCLRTDNGGEYTGDEFDTFCRQDGIERQFTTAYTPQQNEVAEQMNRTLLERARAMLAIASLGKSWIQNPKKCLFLGYADGLKRYLLWDPTAHKVVVSRDVVFMKDKIQKNKEDDSTTRETTSIQMEKDFQSNDSFEVAPQHEVNEINESQAPATRTLNRERRRPGWHSDYVMESNVASMQEEIEALHKNKTWELVPLVRGPNKDHINKLKAQLAKEFEMKDLGPANKILGTKCIEIELVGKLAFTQKLCEENLAKVQYARSYMKGSSDVALCFGESDLIVKGYVDSNYAGDIDGSKSTTGYVLALWGGTVSWVSKQQSVVAMSTTEAEYVAAAQASKVWLKMLLEELGQEQEKITLFCDNQSALYLARNPAFHSKTKHIRVQYHSFMRKWKTEPWIC
nr:Gag-Pol polyprotein [Tanacetum cinerariifolium]